MAETKKFIRKKLAPTVRETGVPRQADAQLTDLRTLHEYIGRTSMVAAYVGETVQPPVALTCLVGTPTIGWTNRAPSSEANRILSPVLREFSLGARGHG